MRVDARIVVGWTVSVLAVASLAVAQGRDLRLVEAVKNRDRQVLQTLLKQKVDVNAPQPDGSTAIHWAAQSDDLETADLLIGAGAQVSTANDYGITPLLLASQNGSAAMVERLLKAGAKPNAALPTGETALMTAARTGKPGAVQALLVHGADVNAKEPLLGQTALMWAAAQGHSEVVQLLVEGGADVRAKSNPGSLRQPSIVHTGGFTPLLFAARSGDIKSSRILLAAGANVNETAADGMTPLLMATIRGHLEYAEFLLDQKANPDIATAGLTPLHRAAGEWNSLVTQRIGIATEDNNEWGVLGGMRGQVKLDFIKLLLARGANPNARTTKNPPRYGSGGGPRFGDSRTPLIGGTPFIFAAMAGDVPAMRLLLAAGANPKAATDDETTALILAAGFGYNPDGGRVTEANALEAVKLLVELGVDVNATNDMDSTALHGAASRGANSIIQFLVDKGADLEAKNARGWTAMTYAEGIFQNNTIVPFPSTEALLSKMGAKPSPPGLVRHKNDEAGVEILGRRGKAGVKPQPGETAKPKP